MSAARCTRDKPNIAKRREMRQQTYLQVTQITLITLRNLRNLWMELPLERSRCYRSAPPWTR